MMLLVQFIISCSCVDAVSQSEAVLYANTLEANGGTPQEAPPIHSTSSQAFQVTSGESSSSHQEARLQQRTQQSENVLEDEESARELQQQMQEFEAQSASQTEGEADADADVEDIAGMATPPLPLELVEDAPAGVVQEVVAIDRDEMDNAEAIVVDDLANLNGVDADAEDRQGDDVDEVM